MQIRKAGQRAARASILHADGSIPSYEASRMLIRDDGSIAGTVEKWAPRVTSLKNASQMCSTKKRFGRFYSELHATKIRQTLYLNEYRTE